MKLITKALEERFEKIGDQSEIQDPIIVAKFFNPAGRQTWYASEYDKENNICFGYVTGFDFDEWGYFSIDELESLKLPFGLKVERDIFFKEIRFQELVKQKDLER
ncbi:MAG TPA: DUF2958 domain-containing protein [Flavobacterium sp.]|uniref:DUF2958 domain-containing protein n=1 Tax=unclassified Flavobacterium TaxID=196869 RepID=UPI000E86DD27|nr:MULTISPECIES: DUF2958 domain-containing protein [unclassified Flavobacterium]HBI01414.1 hypothetical protein [Flavobacterium sp.]HRE76368.1 DUF2958 domain-containing protein [Flavobacterium sp.]